MGPIRGLGYLAMHSYNWPNTCKGHNNSTIAYLVWHHRLKLPRGILGVGRPRSTRYSTADDSTSTLFLLLDTVWMQ